MASSPRSGSKGNNRRNDFTMEFPSDQTEHSETKSEKSSGTDSKACDDIYAILDDKNRAIEVLKRRLANQKLQLGYYLHKNFVNDQVRDFSGQCYPHLAEDNTQISLAMYKFLKDTGGKTRLAQLREKLKDCSERVHKALLRQEQLMRGGLSLELEPIDAEGQEENFTVKYDEIRFAKKALGVAQLEISSRLLSVILNVREEMEKFRMCAEDIVKLEEDRNLLVDRVFSLPAEKRYDMHLASLNLDEQQNHQEVPQGDATRGTSTISISTNTTDADFTNYIENAPRRNLDGALHDMESEALELLMMSERQKNDFVLALEDARMENQHLKDRLTEMEEAASDERVMKLQEKCMNIETEVEEMRNTFEIEQNEKELALQKLAIELCNKEASEQRLQQDMKNLSAALEVLRNERNELQQKCEEEQMKNCFAFQNTSTDMIGNSELETQEVDELTDLVVIQEEQIKDLLSILSELQTSLPLYRSSENHSRNNSNIEGIKLEEIQEVEEYEQAKQTDEIMCSADTEVDDNLSNNINLDALDSGIFAPLKQITPPKFTDFETNKSCDHNEEIINHDNSEVHDSDDDVCHIFFDSSSESNVKDDESSPLITETLKTEDITSATQISAPSSEKIKIKQVNKSERSLRSSRSTSRKVFGNKKPIQILKKKSSGLATTSLRVEAFDENGKSESMHAVLESSSPVDGLLELNNSSKLHLRLQCTSPQRNEYSLMTINEDGVNEESCTFCPDDVAGDHIHNHVPRKIAGGKKQPKEQANTEHLNFDKSTKLFLTKQLKKLKKQLRDVSSSQGKAEVFHNFKQVYSNLLGGVSEDLSEGFS